MGSHGMCLSLIDRDAAIADEGALGVVQVRASRLPGVVGDLWAVLESAYTSGGRLTMIVPYGDPGEESVALEEIEISAVGGISLAVIVAAIISTRILVEGSDLQSVDFLVGQRYTLDGIAPAVCAVFILCRLATAPEPCNEDKPRRCNLQDGQHSRQCPCGRRFRMH